MSDVEILKRQLVSEVYHAILKREPDAGIDYHLRKLQNIDPGRFGDLLREVFRSPEFRARSMDFFAPRPARTEYKHVISLGTHCYTAMAIKSAGLRRGAFPFDWIFSSPAMVKHCLEDNFSQFMNASNIKTVPLADRPHGPHYNKCHNLYYLLNHGVSFVFNHHDMTAGEARSYFTRAIERLYALLNTSEAVLFVQCTPFTERLKANFIELCELLGRFRCRSRLLVFGIDEVKAENAMPQMDRSLCIDGHELYRLRPVSAWMPLRFEDPVDDLAILRNIYVHGVSDDRIYSPWSQL